MNTRKEWAIRSVACLVVSSLIVGFVLFTFPSEKSDDARDFSEYYAAAQIVRQGLGRELYDLRTQAEFQSRISSVQVFYNHPPFETLVFLPLTYFGYRTAYMLWTLIGVGLLAGAVLLTESQAGVTSTIFRYTRIPVDFGLAFVLFLTFAPVTTCLLLGQDSMLMLFIYTLVFVLLRRGADLRAGCVLACGLFKFQLIVPFVLILLLRRRWAAARGFSLAGSFLILASIGVSGIQVLAAYPRFLLFESSHQQVAGFAPEYMPNIRGILHLLVDSRLGSPVFGALVALISGFVLWLVAKNWRDEQLGLSFSAAVFATVLVSYHLYNYDLTLLLLPIAIVCDDLARRDRPFSSQPALSAALVILFIPPLHRLFLLHGVYALMAIPIVGLSCTVLSVMSSARGQANEGRHAVDGGICTPHE
jgi:Glycosyltransferase family 87